MLKELGLEYHNVDEPDLTSESFRALNPNAKVPVLVDGDVVLFESLAINLYLAQRYASPLWPTELSGQARAVQWSFWAATELEEQALVVLRNRALLPLSERDPAAANTAEASARPALEALELALTPAPWLLGSSFSVADLNVASIAILTRFAGFDYAGLPHVDAWLEAAFARPAARSAGGG
jgi:glutathione S-transferase